jgi:signal transduction histidine kinase
VAAGAVLLFALAALFLLWRWTAQKKRLAENEKELAHQQIVRLEQEKQLVATQAMLDGEVRERTRLSRDLHDGMGGMLSAIKFQLADMKKHISPRSASSQTCDRAMDLLDESMREMRRIAHHLMPESLSRLGLKTALAEFCKSVPHARFTWFGSEERIDAKLELIVYRIAYELVNNALKHSGAGHIMVQIVRDPDRISLTVQDDGCGFDPGNVTEGMGLSNIRTHVASYNGLMDIGSVAGEGTEVNVEFSINS